VCICVLYYCHRVATQLQLTNISYQYGAETWTLPKLAQKYLERFEMLCWRKLEKISSTDRVGKEEVSHRVKERNILFTIKQGKVRWIGHILRRDCLLKHAIEGRIEVTRR